MIVGIDVSTKKLAFVGIHDDGTIYTAVELIPAHLRGADRFVIVRALVEKTMVPMFGVSTKAVAVEIPWAPKGQSSFSLLGTAAVVLEAVASELPGAVVMEIPPSTWKKDSIGRGDATKEQGMAHAKARGLTVDDQDLADALCIAECMVGRWDTRTEAAA